MVPTDTDDGATAVDVFPGTILGYLGLCVAMTVSAQVGVGSMDCRRMGEPITAQGPATAPTRAPSPARAPAPRTGRRLHTATPSAWPSACTEERYWCPAQPAQAQPRLAVYQPPARRRLQTVPSNPLPTLFEAPGSIAAPSWVVLWSENASKAA